MEVLVNKKSTLDNFNEYIVRKPTDNGSNVEVQSLKCIRCKHYNVRVTAVFGYASSSDICNHPDKCNTNFNECELFEAK